MLEQLGAFVHATMISWRNRHKNKINHKNIRDEVNSLNSRYHEARDIKLGVGMLVSSTCCIRLSRSN